LLSKEKINPGVFYLLVKSSHVGLAGIIKLFMKSKTETDMNYLKKISNVN
jgi:hypothetical protein